MFKSIYFIGTGCGRPISERQLPCYLVEMKDFSSVLMECGTIINTSNTSPININKINHIIISAPDVELFSGLPSLLHSMRLLNRKNTLNIIAPSKLKNIIDEISKIDKFAKGFRINFKSIENHTKTALGTNMSIITKKSKSRKQSFQIYLTDKSETKQSSIFYTGKSRNITDPSLLGDYNYIIHDCTYSYAESFKTKETGLSSYKDVLEFNKKLNPNIMFLVHFSTRYEGKIDEIDKHHRHPDNILYTYDGFRYDFIRI